MFIKITASAVMTVAGNGGGQFTLKRTALPSRRNDGGQFMRKRTALPSRGKDVKVLSRQHLFV